LWCCLFTFTFIFYLAASQDFQPMNKLQFKQEYATEREFVSGFNGIIRYPQAIREGAPYSQLFLFA
jgi:hypothetical protein